MTDYYAALHIHTSYSDGVYTPGKIVDIAKNSHISVIAITDHDSVAGIDEAIYQAKDRLNIIPAVEFSANIGHQDIYISAELLNYLGYHSPYYVAKKELNPKKIIQKIKEWGGIPEDDFYEIAMKQGLLITGGSDFNGIPRGYCKIGEYGCQLNEVLNLKKCAGK